MKKQISRLSPHQNGKVFGVLFATASLLFAIPSFIAFMLMAPPTDAMGNPMAPPAYVFLLFPLLYLVMGYLTVAVICALYNFLYKYIGGIEFDERSEQERPRDNA
jgi:ABC-type multidrug transport system fused ATPase/permease subunit